MMQPHIDAASTDRPAAFRVLVFASVGHAYAHLFMVLYPTVVLALEAEFAMTYGELIGLALGGYILFGAAALPAGWLGDRWSARGMMAVMFFGLGVASVATGFASSSPQIALGLGVIGIFAAIYHPVGIAMVVRHATRRGQALGVNGIFGGVGVAVGALAAGVLSDLVSWRAAFIVPGTISLLTGFAYLAYVPRIAPAEVVHNSATETPAPEGRLADILPVLILIILASACAGLIYQSASVGMPKIFATRLAFLDGAVIGVGGLVALVYLIGAGGQIIGGWLSDRYPLRRVFALAFTLHIPLLAFAANAGDWSMLVLVICLVTLGSSVQPVADSLVANCVPSRWHATAFGARFVASLGVSACSIPLVGLIFDRTGGFAWLFVVMSVLAIVATILALLLPRESAVASRIATPMSPAVAVVDGPI
jgi:FSR family fosmidomycin resistance protein-like MFS transporter